MKSKEDNVYPKMLGISVVVGLATFVSGFLIALIMPTIGISMSAIGGVIWTVSVIVILMYYLQYIFSNFSEITKAPPASKRPQKQKRSKSSIPINMRGIFKSQKKDLENFLKLLEVSTDEELAEHLIFAAIARNENPNLTTNFLNSLPHFKKDDVHKVKAELQMINLQLRDDVNQYPIIAGNVIWVMTLRSVESFEHLILAKKIWRELKRGHKDLKNKAVEMQLENSEKITQLAKFTPKL